MSTNQETVSNPVEDALRVMGAEFYDPSHYAVGSQSHQLKRLKCGLMAHSLDDPEEAALFIHECKLYLREKGHTGFDVRGAEKGEKTFLSVYGRNVCGVSLTAPTEHEAWAKAVLSTVPPQVGEVKG